MNIDERLEALTQSVELLARLHQQTENEIQRTQKQIRGTEERVTKLDENMLVQAELVARFERKVDAWIEQAEERMQKSEADVTELRAMWTAVIERWDRFIQGREGNGSKF
jgi:predicted  nucleic acid-binding Zn-ribbon protein